MQKYMRQDALCGILLILSVVSASADQPIMNMMPRWDGGYGIQFLYGSEHGDELVDGSNTAPNPLGQEFTKDTLDIQGVYTWHRWIRATFKLPYVVHQSRVVERDGVATRETGEGFDDLELNLPLKKYFNETGYTGNLTVNPRIRLPIGDDDDPYPVADGSFDFGISVGGERESYNFFLAGGVGVWFNGSEDSNVREFNGWLDLGWNATDALAIYWEFDPEWEFGRGDNPDHFTLQSGPAVYYRWNDTVHTRVEYKTPLYEDADGLTFTDGSELKAGIGFVF